MSLYEFISPINAKFKEFNIGMLMIALILLLI